MGNRLEGRVAIVTGSGRGIGRNVAMQLAQEGASVVVNDLGVEVDGSEPSGGPADDVVKEIKDAGGTAVAAYDSVADYTSSSKIVQVALDNYGKIDILVHLAGILRDRMVFNMTEQGWDGVLQVHLYGAFNMVHNVIPHMMDQRYGRIVIFSSGSGLGSAGQANYAASKAGAVGMSKALAAEVATRGITVNCIAPGFIQTDMTESLGEDQTEKLLSAIPAARLGSPEDVAACAVFLASDEAAYVTGQTLHVNGGMAMI